MMETTTKNMVTYQPPETGEIERRAGNIVGLAQKISVDSPESLAAADAFWADCNQAQKWIKAEFEPARKAQDDAKKALLAQRDNYAKPFEEAKSIVKPKIAEYKAIEAKVAAEEAARLQAEAKAAAEEQQLREAIAAEEAGDSAEATEILNEEIVVPTVRAPMQPIKSSTPIRTNWKWQLTDVVHPLRKLMESYERWVREGKDPGDWPHLWCLALDEKAIGATVRAQKGKVNLPGIETFAESV